ncbi:unnamed protein product [Pleuronectes platessa]|uniref:G-protein coupled receptors family 2 profile 2 domain-containing protein n=1 Tax=Pleuronectes platessa TaxID=8262 RepID=A0A9N7TRW4_PLEPL|nr:unnamed protein product [Pleuronectes platessa]
MLFSVDALSVCHYIVESNPVHRASSAPPDTNLSAVTPSALDSRQEDESDQDQDQDQDHDLTSYMSCVNVPDRTDTWKGEPDQEETLSPELRCHRGLQLLLIAPTVELPVTGRLREEVVDLFPSEHRMIEAGAGGTWVEHLVSGGGIMEVTASEYNVYRNCLSNGTWALKGNYSMCKAILEEGRGQSGGMGRYRPSSHLIGSRRWPRRRRDKKKSKMHYQIAVIINYLGHFISMVALLVAFFLFLCLRSIRCLRNIIHWNLITAFILRNATWFIVQMTMSPEVHESNVIWCRLVTASFNYFHSTNFFWMFGEGCYLHTAIVLTYSTDKLRKWMFICIGWCTWRGLHAPLSVVYLDAEPLTGPGSDQPVAQPAASAPHRTWQEPPQRRGGIPFPIIVAWAIGKLYYDNEKCWFGKQAGVYTDYIYQGPMILVLVINFIFLFNIVRILMTKLRASTTSETIQYRKAVKATLVLLPLLGITYMLFFVNPGEDDISQNVFIYFNSFLESFQGFFVSVFYCFLNSECQPSSGFMEESAVRPA